ncbi:Fe-S cluster assembly ATPase SufC [Candidatus Pacearchaeota archaeon]|nr:Fe-S cluster assembly ATPase SufC [Candidatus Pacearchaeota archaeon]
MENNVWIVLRPNYSKEGILKEVGICGSGFFIDEKTFITSYHILNESSFIPNKKYFNRIIILMNSEGKKIEITRKEVYQYIPSLDLTIVKTLEKENFFGIGKKYSKGDQVKNIGYPEEKIKEILDKNLLTVKKQFENSGKVLDIIEEYSIYANDVKIENKKVIILDYSLEKGFSGGPLFKDGKVIGILSHINPLNKKAVAIAIDELEREIKNQNPSSKLLEIKNLHVEVEGKEILKGINLNLDLGKINALMGPNGSGKSTLVNTIMGHPRYKITQGKIVFKGKEISKLSPDKRAKLGIFLSFQYPREISGISVSKFLKTASKELNPKFSIFDFKKNLKEKTNLLEISNEMTERYLNEGFSGGEKKKNEILQMLVLNPNLIMLDETDSGLDVDSLKIVAKGVNEIMNQEKCTLIITHYKRILEHIKPNKIFIMLNGKIVLEGGKEIVDQLEEKGYGWIEKD